jgi:hypothetical protein
VQAPSAINIDFGGKEAQACDTSRQIEAAIPI